MSGSGRRTGFTRHNSICPTPEEILLKSVLRNDRRHIIRLVENNPTLLEYIYDSTYNKPILLIACTEESVEGETVRTLINLGADLLYSSELDEEWQAIHFTAVSTKSEKLRVVVDCMKERLIDINTPSKSGNALHVLIRFGNKEYTDEFLKCAKILVQEGIDVNQGDWNDVSPILWAAKKGLKEIIKIILECSYEAVDLDSHKSRNKTARDIILKEKLYDGILPEQMDTFDESDINTLFKFLKNKKEDAFINCKNGDIFDLVDIDNGCSTLLQIACERCLKKSAEHLIDKGADPNLTTSKNRKLPILICAENGFYEIFEILLNHPKIRITNTILITLIKNLDNKKLFHINHEECYDILLEKMKVNVDLLDINEVDESNNSPLHYAVRYAEPEKVEKLLGLGASLGSKNINKMMPIQDILPETLEQHLDNCVEFDVNDKKFEREDFSVTFNYTTLIPPIKAEDNLSSISSDSTERETETSCCSNNNVPLKFATETEVISYMSKAPEFKHLLTHPVVVSFLFVKWQRIRWLFYINLAFYIAFFSSMVVYIFTWNPNSSRNDLLQNVVANVSFGIFFITYIVLLCRELFQMTVSPDKYFKHFDNYVEIILIFVTGPLLFISDPTDDTGRVLSSVSILLAAFELVLMVGQHPKLSTNVVMLETVSKNFFKFLIWYSLLIVAFALSFYILFAKTEVEVKNNNTENEENEEEENFFADPGISVFKTIVMLTGEFDAGSLHYQHFPITSKIMLTLFIFMIAIILVNLLNGLAVNDTQQIKSNSELVGHIARAQHLHYVESMLLGNILPRSFLNRISSFCCCFSGADANLKISRTLAERAYLFPQNVNYKLMVHPNKKGEICLEKKSSVFQRFCLSSCGCGYLRLDKETIRRTNKIIQDRREAARLKKKNLRLENIETVVEKLVKNVMNKTTDDISSLNSKLDQILKYISVENNQ